MPPQSFPPNHSILCVDLDGTLLRTDTLWESFIQTLKRNPTHALLAPLWLAQGKHILKHRLAESSALDVANLPFDPVVLSRLREEKERGRTIILATGASAQIANAIANHLGIFDGVVASNHENLTGSRKLARLKDDFGERSFDYWGDSWTDQVLWRHTGQAYLFGASEFLRSRIERSGIPIASFHPKPQAGLRIWLKHLRVHQWAKNLLVFLPILLSHSWGQPAVWASGLIAFASMCLVASATYALNDMLDLPSDRAHATKRFRPLASGTISLPMAAIAAILMFGSGFGLALWGLPPNAIWLIVIYCLTTLWYSLQGKSLLLIDSITLASLYVLRVFVGAEAEGVRISSWTLGYAGFLFASLALMKRAAEIASMDTGAADPVRGRAYRRGDLQILTAVGVSTGMIALTLFALYIQSTEASRVYRFPERLFFLCIVHAYWIARAWMLTNRREMNEDPVVFALKDRATWLLGLIAVAVILIAT